MFRKLDQRKQNFYKKIAQMVSKINNKRATVKSEIYKTPTPERFHALLHKVLINYKVLREIVKEADFMKDISLGCVIAYEVLTRNIKNDGFRRQFKRLLGERKLKEVKRRIYIRINTLKGKAEDLMDFNLKPTSVPDVYEVLDQNAEIKQEYSADVESYDADVNDESQDEAKEEKSESEEYEVLNEEPLQGKKASDLFRSPEIMDKIKVQNYSSCLPAFILNPEPNSSVIDGAAAPGNKTTHLCSIMNNTGVIHAFERNKDRFELLKKQIELYGATNIQALHKDFLKASPEEYKADYVLLDPSCSGSGIHANYVKSQKRIDTLKNFQAMMLNHSFKFKPKKIVYSVCSEHHEEGEDVVMEALEKNLEYELERIADLTNRRGHEGYPFSDLVIRTQSTEEGDIGFFVALFKRKDL